MKNLKLITASAVTAITLIGGLSLWQQNQTRNAEHKQAEARKRVFGILKSLGQDFTILPSDAWAQEASEDEAASTACNNSASEARAACKAANTDYAHGALRHFNNSLCFLNNETAAIAENNLCHMEHFFGKDASGSLQLDLTSLPQEKTKTKGLKELTVSIASPTEAFAATEGYEFKATVSVNGSSWIVMYWGGADDSSKGFLTQGSGGMDFESSGRTRLLYAQWDRTNEEAQFVRMLATNFNSTTGFLGGTVNPTAERKDQDHVVYGKASFNSTTKDVSTHVVMIEPQRSSTATALGCFKMFASGVKESTITLAKTENALMTTGCATTDTNKDATALDFFSGTDSKDTVDGTGNSTSAPSGFTVTLDKSCNDLKTAGDSGGPFGGGNVTFTLAPADVFGT